MNKLAELYFYGLNFERESNFYKNIGIRKFKYFLPTFGDFVIQIINKVKNSNTSIVNTKENALIWTMFTILLESLHGIVFLIMNVLIYLTIAKGRLIWASSLILINLLVNLYPSFVQRYNRIRLIRVYNIKPDELKRVYFNISSK